MKVVVVSFVLLVIDIVTADAGTHLNDTEVTTTSDKHLTLTSSSEEIRWTPFFPKNGHKFILTTKSTRARNHTTPLRSKNPVLNVVPKAVKMKGKNYWETATTRRPVMKYTKFTINPLTTFKILANSLNRNKKLTDKDTVSEGKYENNLFSKIMDTSKESSEEDSENSIVNVNRENKTKRNKTWTSLFHKVQSKITKEKSTEENNKLHTINIQKIKTSESDLSSEEKEDREEFIFVTPKIIKTHSVVLEDSDESGETTTTIEKELKLRHTRSVNVIEEENLGTTVSGFKFTGKVASLSNDLIFRNINI